MDRLKVIETFVAVATKGSLTAAAKLEGIAPAVVGRRIDALEERLGVKLFTRTTRRITLTREGGVFLEDCQRLLADLANAEANVSIGSVKVSGSLHVTAPAGFGRRHVAPMVPRFLAMHPNLNLSLNLSDRLVDLPNEGFDCAIRVGDMPDSNLVAMRLADNRRQCVAAPAYLDRVGIPKTPAELAKHECLVLTSDASQTRGWAFAVDGAVTHVRPTGRLTCNDGQVLHEWCLAGSRCGLAQHLGGSRRLVVWPLGKRAGRVCSTPHGHLCRLRSAQTPTIATAVVGGVLEASLGQPGVLARGCGARQSGCR